VAVTEGRVLDADEAATLLHVTRRWLMREGIRKYKVPFLRPPGSRTILFLESDMWRVLDSWRENSKIGNPPRGRKVPAKKKARR
jgi:hypothetical protein